MSKYFLEELAAYGRSRLASWRILALWLGMAAAALLISRSFSISDAIVTFWLTALLIIQFRLMDDLHDIPHDRLHAPERVLVKSPRLTGYYVAQAVLIIITGASFAIFRSDTQWVVYLLLYCLAESLYRMSGWQGKKRLLRNQLILLKYPVFLFLCSVGASPVTLMVISALAYFTLFTEECLTNKTPQDR